MQVDSGKENFEEVALLTEGVDRNHPVIGGGRGYAVALLTEGVDRNTPKLGFAT